MRQPAEADFSEFAAASARELRRTAYLMCADWQRAEDATQDALLKVYLNWSRLERRGGLRAYSRRVLVSCVIDQGRRPWRRERPVDELPDGVVVAARAEPSIDDRDAVMAALARLPVRQRACVVLRHYDDMSVNEVARVLSITTGAVKSQTSRGLAALREALKPNPTSDATRGSRR